MMASIQSEMITFLDRDSKWWRLWFGVVLVGLVCFIGGYVVGRAHVPERPPVAERLEALESAVAGLSIAVGVANGQMSDVEQEVAELVQRLDTTHQRIPASR